MDWPVPERAGSGQILHILNIHCVPSLMGDNTNYFSQNVIYYSYKLLFYKSNILQLQITFKSNALQSSYFQDFAWEFRVGPTSVSCGTRLLKSTCMMLR